MDYYYGPFRDLAIVQTPSYDIQNYHLLRPQKTIDEDTTQNAKERYTQSLVPIVDILIPNRNNIMAFPIKEIYSYYLSLEKIQELTKYDLTQPLPNIEHHENEVRELQRIA